ncbi:flagellar basal-body rod protein FlgF [Deltaproteobacteria bacterium TL4]
MGIASLISAGGVLERKLDNTANNLANVNTSGYKEDQLSFREVLSKATRVAPESDEEMFLNHENLDLYVGMDKSAVAVDAVGINFTPGMIRHTNNPLDFSIDNDGFFSVSTPQGERYTRSGNFSLDSNSQVVTEDGYPLLGKRGPIVVKGKDIVVDENGGFHVDGKLVDSLRVVRFKDKQDLQKLGHAFFAPVKRDNVPIESKEIKVRQGVLEGSNVNTVKEMTNMVAVNRAYETIQKALRAVDGLDEKAITLARV